MHENDFAQIGLVMAADDPHVSFYREALEHAGIHFEWVERGSYDNLSMYDVLLFVGHDELTSTQREKVQSWMRLGGSIVCSGATWGLDALLGIERTAHERHPSRELIFPTKVADRAWPEKAGPARFFGGIYAKAIDATPIAQTSTGTVASSRKKLGKGVALFLCVNLGQTMAQMQMGHAVESDGVGPSDGSAKLDDGRLRAEDGIVLDFDKDRSQPENASHPLFAVPHADIVRELWLRLVLEAAETSGKRVSMTWPWPNNAEGGACITVDCEEFNGGNVASLHNILSLAGASAAWMVAHPGYSLDVYRNIKKWEHEVGILFSPEEDGSLNEERLKVQHVAMSRVVGVPIISSIRLPDGGWFRYDRLYELADATGSRVSVSKGGRQPGTSGFAFGTCHPFHPRRRDGSSMRVLEIPYHVFMPGHVVEEPAIVTLIEQTAARHGCLHTVVTSPATQDGRVALVLRRSISLMKQAKLEFMLPCEIARFERTRRTLRIKQWREREQFGINLIADEEIEGLTLLVSGSGLEATLNGKPLKTQLLKRYGMTWSVLTLDLGAKAQASLVLVEPTESRLAA